MRHALIQTIAQARHNTMKVALHLQCALRLYNVVSHHIALQNKISQQTSALSNTHSGYIPTPPFWYHARRCHDRFTLPHMKQLLMHNRLLPLKIAAIGLWISLVLIGLIYVNLHHLTILQIVSDIRVIVQKLGPIGLLLVIGIYALRPLLFFPATPLSLTVAAIYPAYLAFPLLLVAELVSSTISYTLGRVIGKGILGFFDQKNTILQTIEQKVRGNGFSLVLTLRLLFAPLDAVGYASGATSITYGAFILATLMGIIPGLLLVVLLGSAASNPLLVIPAALVALFVLGSTYYFKRERS
jgi:uncharacterized membrane protein YdjX (TVP38/TMEM64 family)